jgi:hypothetical protein
MRLPARFLISSVAFVGLSSAVSSDGKTRTVTTKGANAAGQQLSNVAVYEKQ